MKGQLYSNNIEIIKRKLVTINGQVLLIVTIDTSKNTVFKSNYGQKVPVTCMH